MTSSGLSAGIFAEDTLLDVGGRLRVDPNHNSACKRKISNTDKAWMLIPLWLGDEADVVLITFSPPTLQKLKLGIVLHQGILGARESQRVNAGLWC